jgi:hypothetical protein
MATEAIQTSISLDTEYIYIGRTYCIGFPMDTRILYMNGLVHTNFPRNELVDNDEYYDDFIHNAYRSIKELVDGLEQFKEDDPLVRIVYGDVYYIPSTYHTFVLPKIRGIRDIQRQFRRFSIEKWETFKCRSHPLSEYFYRWKGRYPTYEEYITILKKIPF